MWERSRHWLAKVAVADPVDRRNAPFLQVLLIFIGCFVPLNKAYYLYAVHWLGWTAAPGMSADIVSDALLVTVSWLCVPLIRRGHFRGSVWLFLGVILTTMAIGYSGIDINNLARDPMPLLALAISGLVLGRRALWSVFALLLAIFLEAAAFAVSGIVPTRSPVLVNVTALLLALVAAYLLITLLLDHTVAALRESLAESNLRGRELDQANRRLLAEMGERELAQEKLLHAQKMEAAGRVASGVAHDFDNVLNVIVGYAGRRERLADHGMDALVEALAGVELAARRGMAISRKLLNFSRQDVTCVETFDAAAALRELEPMLRQLFMAGTTLQVDTEGEELPVALDRGQFELMVLNIAANARDAMQQAPCFHIQARAKGDPDEVLMSLRDNGHGMPPERLQRIFEPFFTSKPIGSGTGLGLSVVHELVTSAGGRIQVQSTPGVGTTFQITLPRARLRADPAGG